MAYVTNDARGTVSVITTATGAVSATLTIAGPARVAITTDGRHTSVSNFGDDTVSVITTATGAVSAPVAVGKAAAGWRSARRRSPTNADRDMAAPPPAFMRRKPTIALSGYTLPEL
jgi:YVTN family beta-propeller protein